MQGPLHFFTAMLNVHRTGHNMWESGGLENNSVWLNAGRVIFRQEDYPSPERNTARLEFRGMLYLLGRNTASLKGSTFLLCSLHVFSFLLFV